MAVLDSLLTRQQLAERLGVHPRTLIRWDLRREGPPAIRIGRKIRYNPESVDRWLADCEKQPTPRRRGRR